jgi:peptidoglycan/xylan/chitin deacetylase (PgdA/CDA1 family)
MLNLKTSLAEISTIRATAAPLKLRLASNAAPSMRARGRRGARALVASVVPSSVVVWRGPSALARGESGAGRVALTFDDGPTSLTRDYLAVLARFDARATFFLVGELCARHPELVRAIVDAGHEVAGHGYTHRRFPDLSPAALRMELEQTSRLLPPDANKRALVRPPHGAISLPSTVATFRAGYTTALWSYDSGDWATETAAEVAERFVEQPLEPGEIVLLHEGQTWTLDALPRVLETLRSRGHELRTLGELLGR